MKQILKLNIKKAFFINSTTSNYLTLCLNQKKQFDENPFKDCKKKYQPISFVVKYFMSSQPGGMKFKSKFSKKNQSNKQSSQKRSISQNQTQQRKSENMRTQKQILKLTEQYLGELKSDQFIGDQSQNLQDFSITLKEKSEVDNQIFNQQENIQSSFNWMEKLVYDSQKKMDQGQTQQKLKKSRYLVEKSRKNQEKAIELDRQILVARAFESELPKNVLIENSRKFLQYSCHLFNQYQLLRIMQEIKEYVKKIEYNQSKMITPAFKNSQVQNLKSQTKRMRQQKKKDQMNFFKNIRKIIYESIADPELVNKIIILLSKSDPKILKIEDIDKFIYKHDQGPTKNNRKHKAQLEVIFRNLPNYLQNNEQFHTSIEQINKTISSKTEFLQQIQKISTKQTNLKKLQPLVEEQQDLVDVFEQFSKSQKQIDKKINENETSSHSEPLSRQRQFKLMLKKTNQEPQQQFQIKQSSLNQIDRVLFKNTKIVQDKIIMKKERKGLKNLSLKQKQEEDKKIKFGQNWVYVYELPYDLKKQQSQEIIYYISKKWGEITEFYVYPYKNFLQKKQNEVIHIQISQQQRNKIQNLKQQSVQDVKKLKKQTMTDKLLQKINKEKFLKLNKSSMIFKFKNLQDKQRFLSKQLRLFGLNIALYRNIRFQQAQSKTILALSMVPWGCSSIDLVNAINVQLKPINVQVTYEKCIIAKGYIFIQLDSFYQTLKSRDLINNLVFQNQRLKAQINYGSSKVYAQKYKGSLQFDHYQSLINKLKQINCFYNELYQ